MAGSHKKAIVRRMTGEVLPGYLPLSGLVQRGSGQGAGLSLELLDLAGRVISLQLSDVKMVSYVRDFNLSDTTNPERLLRRTFLARPRGEGLWVRLTFATGETLEGLAPTDTSLLDDLVKDAGLFLTPPDVRSNTQRIFVPRSSVETLQLIAVITTPSKRKPLPSQEKTTLQEDLFAAPLPPGARPN